MRVRFPDSLPGPHEHGDRGTSVHALTLGLLQPGGNLIVAGSAGHVAALDLSDDYRVRADQDVPDISATSQRTTVGTWEAVPLEDLLHRSLSGSADLLRSIRQR